MAQYTYICASCKHEFDEIIWKISKRDDFQICPKCEGDSYRKKISDKTLFNITGGGVYRQGMPKQ